MNKPKKPTRAQIECVIILATETNNATAWLRTKQQHAYAQRAIATVARYLAVTDTLPAINIRP